MRFFSQYFSFLPVLLRLLWLLPIMLLIQGCPEDKKSEDGDASLTGQPVSEIELSVLMIGSTVVITPLNLPDKRIITSECRVNEIIGSGCADGLQIKNPADGAYAVEFTFAFEPGFTLSKHEEFEIRERKVIRKFAPDTKRLPITLDLDEASSSFLINQAVDRKQPLVFYLKLSGNEGCAPEFWCNRNGNIWSFCNGANLPIVSLLPREILPGFQRISIKAKCRSNEIESNVITLAWYGVEPGYKHLTIKTRLVGNQYHFLLEREVDCPSQLSYFCRDSANEDFKVCFNLKEDPAPGFQIKALCNGDEGPVYTVAEP